MPHVLHIMHAYVPATLYGGIVAWTRDVCERQADAGLRVSVACMASFGGEPPPPEMHPLDTWQPRAGEFRVKYYREQVRDRISVSMLRGLRDDIEAADVVHLHGIFYAFFPVALRLARRLRKPAVVSVHGMLSDWQLAQSPLAKRAFLAACVRPYAREVQWHATCDAEEGDVRRLFAGAHVRMIPNGVDVAGIAAAIPAATAGELRARYAPEEAASGPVVAALCRLHHKKGLDLLIRAAAMLRAGSHPDLVVLIGGEDDGDGARLRDLVVELGLTNAVKFVGQLDGADKWALLAAADVFAMPSHDENFGISYAEALACGTPIVASVHTPWAVVERDGSGRWITLDVDRVAASIAELIAEDGDGVARRCRRTAGRFDWGEIVPRISAMYGV